LTQITDAVRLNPVSGAPPEQIVLLLHGFGSDGSDMIPLARHWQDALPNAVFVAPRAPLSSATVNVGHAWWDMSALDAEAVASGAATVAPMLNTFIDNELARHGLAEEDLVLVGFSQGTMLALYVGLRDRRQVAAIIGYSGTLPSGRELPTDPPTPPVLLVHGSADPVVPLAALQAAKTELNRLGVQVSTHVCHGQGHSIDSTGLMVGRDFAREALLAKGDA